MDELNKKNGIDIVRVPFRSGNEMVNAVMSGTTPIVFLGLANMIGQVKSGQFTGLALNANARSPLFPDIPTLLRGDRRGLSAALVRPVRAGRHAAADRRQAARRGRADRQRCPAWRQRNFIDRAVEPAVGPRDEFIKFIANNRAFAARVAKETGIQPQ